MAHQYSVGQIYIAVKKFRVGTVSYLKIAMADGSLLDVHAEDFEEVDELGRTIFSPVEAPKKKEFEESIFDYPSLPNFYSVAIAKA